MEKGASMRGARWRPLLAALGGLAAGSALLGLSRRWLFPVAVAGESMTPAFEAGDYVLVRRGVPPRGDDATGLVVCVRGPENRLLLGHVLREMGFQVTEADSAQTAARLLKSNESFSLAVIDLYLPELDGTLAKLSVAFVRLRAQPSAVTRRFDSQKSPSGPS